MTQQNGGDVMGGVREEGAPSWIGSDHPPEWRRVGSIDVADPADVRWVCSDSDGEGKELLTTAPPFTDDLLTRYFEDVC